MLSSVFLPLFFIPLSHVAGFDLNLNFICVILLCAVFAIRVNQVLLNPFLVIGIVAPWVLMFVGYIFASSILGQRTSTGIFLAQFAFMLAFVGLGFQLYEWFGTKRGRRKIITFCTISVISFCISLLLFSPFESLAKMIERIALVDPIGTVYYSRRVFAAHLYSSNTLTANLSSFQNTIAQNVFSHGLLISTLCLAVRSKEKSNDFLFYSIQSFSVFMAFFAVLLLSGQNLAQIFIMVAFVALSFVFIRKSYGLMVSVIAFAGVSTLTLIFLSSTDLWARWATRFTSGEIDTGRVERWIYYVSDTHNLTLFGLLKSDTLDPHNLYIGSFFEIGILGLLSTLLFASALTFRVFWGLGSGAKHHGLAYVIMMSAGAQALFATLVSGGWGFPGWGGWMKFSLFILGVLIVPVRPMIWMARTPQTRVPGPYVQ